MKKLFAFALFLFFTQAIFAIETAEVKVHGSPVVFSKYWIADMFLSSVAREKLSGGWADDVLRLLDGENCNLVIGEYNHQTIVLLIFRGEFYSMIGIHANYRKWLEDTADASGKTRRR